MAHARLDSQNVSISLTMFPVSSDFFFVNQTRCDVHSIIPM